MQPEIIVSDPIDVHRRLAELGLSFEILQESILAGELARRSCTPNDAPTMPGLSFWGRTVRTLREKLTTKPKADPHKIEPQWTRSDRGGVPVAVSPDKTFAISVSTGDENTGNSAKTASTKYPKGPETVQAIVRNNGTRFLFEEMEPTDDEEKEANRLTRILLIYRDETGISAELSVPKGVEAGKVISWSERIILPKIDLPDDYERAGLPEDGIDGDDLDIDVTRRSAS